jgi:hypothetical protein
MVGNDERGLTPITAELSGKSWIGRTHHLGNSHGSYAEVEAAFFACVAGWHAVLWVFKSCSIVSAATGFE